MKKLMLMCLGIALALPALAQSQDNSQQPSSQQQQPSSQSSPTSQASPTDASSGNTQMSGMVSKDGKTFTNGQDKHSFKVDNPDALKGHEGDSVGLVVHVDPDTNTIHIIQVAAPQQ